MTNETKRQNQKPQAVFLSEGKSECVAQMQNVKNAECNVEQIHEPLKWEIDPNISPQN